MATIAIVSSLAKEIRVSADTNRAYSNERSREDKCSNNKPTTVAGSVYDVIHILWR